jgi:type IV pilus assembly protein PilW
MLKLRAASPATAAGFTLIEFMIAMTLSLLVLAALTAAFVANSRSRTEIERANEQMENGRFALQIMSDDLETAGYLSHFNPRNAPALTVGFPNVGDLPNPCFATEASLSATMLMHIQGFDDLPATLEDDGIADEANDLDECDFLGDFKAGTDIVVVRRTATCVAGTANCALVAGAPYFQAALCAAELDPLIPTDHFRLLVAPSANLNRRPRSCAGTADLRQYLTHIYFIANNDEAGDGIPTLKRAELVAATGDPKDDFSVVALARGIEDFQIEYGVDNAGADGAPDAFIAAPANVGAWRDVMTVRLHVLARNTEPTRDHVDTKQYVLAQKAPVTPGGPYKRHVYQTTVRLNNPAGRREQ